MEDYAGENWSGLGGLGEWVELRGVRNIRWSVMWRQPSGLGGLREWVELRGVRNIRWSVMWGRLRLGKRLWEG